MFMVQTNQQLKIQSPDFGPKFKISWHFPTKKSLAISLFFLYQIYPETLHFILYIYREPKLLDPLELHMDFIATFYLSHTSWFISVCWDIVHKRIQILTYVLINSTQCLITEWPMALPCTTDPVHVLIKWKLELLPMDRPHLT